MNFRLKKGFMIKKIGEDLVIYDKKSSFLITLNSTAAYILKCINEKKSLADIISLISLDYEIDKVKIKHDVYTILNKLKKHNIVMKIIHKK